MAKWTWCGFRRELGTSMYLAWHLTRVGSSITSNQLSVRPSTMDNLKSTRDVQNVAVAGKAKCHLSLNHVIRATWYTTHFVISAWMPRNVRWIYALCTLDLISPAGVRQNWRNVKQDYATVSKPVKCYHVEQKQSCRFINYIWGMVTKVVPLCSVNKMPLSSQCLLQLQEWHQRWLTLYILDLACIQRRPTQN